MTGTLGLESISTRLQRIARVSRESPGMIWTTLAHHIDINLLHEAYRQTRKDGAAGIDGKTATDYAGDLESNLKSLCERFKSGNYKAPPVRRGFVPKGDGREHRPIGIPTFEDKILQRAVALVLEAVYEQDFLNCSYGFRPGRSAHQALEDLRRGLMDGRGGTVVEVDIKSFFDAMDHGILRGFLDKRVCDGMIRRIIDKWLAAGVMEEGNILYPETGTPQGGVISPILANIYLHHVMDTWFERVVKPRLNLQAFLVRYADDMVIAFGEERDARRMMEVLPKRFGKYGLTLHPEKTRMVPFKRPPYRQERGRGPGAFEFLGFSHYWERPRRRAWVVRQKTAKSRFSRALKRLTLWCKAVRHEPVAAQHQKLVIKMKGHRAYYGITGNGRALHRFREEVRKVWRKWLCRRSQRAFLPWDRYEQLLKRYPLPPMRVVHSIYGRTANLFS